MFLLAVQTYPWEKVGPGRPLVPTGRLLRIWLGIYDLPSLTLYLIIGLIQLSKHGPEI